MNLIFIEGTAPKASIAVRYEEQLFFYKCSKDRNQLEETLTFMNELVSQNNIDLSRMDAFGYSSGPGSFTGIRMGMMVAQGLSFEDPSKVFPLPCLSALALIVYEKFKINEVCVVRNAFMQGYFIGKFNFIDGVICDGSTEQLIDSNQLGKHLKGFSNIYVPLGESQLIASGLTSKIKVQEIDVNASLLLPVLEKMASGVQGFNFLTADVNYLRGDNAWSTWKS
jgi:tRNA threonylcarbamoyl adenosine modification protein YeaZ